jgi:hypothetical protein
LKKRTKKLLFRCRGLAAGTRLKTKSFLVLFSKKNILAFLQLSIRAPLLAVAENDVSRGGK